MEDGMAYGGRSLRKLPLSLTMSFELGRLRWWTQCFESCCMPFVGASGLKERLLHGLEAHVRGGFSAERSLLLQLRDLLLVHVSLILGSFWLAMTIPARRTVESETNGFLR